MQNNIILNHKNVLYIIIHLLCLKYAMGNGVVVSNGLVAYFGFSNNYKDSISGITANDRFNPGFA